MGLILLAQICISQIKVSPYSYPQFLTKERGQIYELWNTYLEKKSANDTTAANLWYPTEVNEFSNFDILESSSGFTPSLYQLPITNTLLYLKKLNSSTYKITSLFYWLGEQDKLNIFLISNVLAKIDKGNLYLSNYLLYETRTWVNKKVGKINYHYYPEYDFNQKEAEKANETVENINALFSLDNGEIDYYIASDCDEKNKIIGIDYKVTTGVTEECAFFDKKNNIIYTTQHGGENHKHELIHLINKKFPKAHFLLLSGLSVYSNNRNVHIGHSLEECMKILNDNLKSNTNLITNFYDKFPTLKDLNDEIIQADYFYGAVLVDLILEKGGMKLLIDALKTVENDDELKKFINKNLDIDESNIDSIIRKKVSELADENFRPKIIL